MGQKSKIEWTDSTWNPITGCYHGCGYCYARKIADRFEPHGEMSFSVNGEGIIDLNDPKVIIDKNGNARKTPYPFGFAPTFHRYKLNEPQGWKKPRKIFVCSMADMFGTWVPDEWIKQVFEACQAAPQHEYLFLTKNPARYIELEKKGLLPHLGNMWFGSSVTMLTDTYAWMDDIMGFHYFLSVEPMLEPFGSMSDTSIKPAWIIIGAETGNRKSKIVPEQWWIDELVSECKKYEIPVFMKDSLRPIVGKSKMLRQFPESLIF